MGLPKNIVYRFVDDPRWDELEVDRAGALTFKKGDVLTIGGKQWQVDKARWELSDEESKRVPTLRIDLKKA
jgi:hypothetical protein